MRHSAPLLLSVVLAACGSSAGSSSAPTVLELDVEGTMRAGTSAVVKNTDLEVKFVEVTEDSRCPRDATCVWAGEVKVKMETRIGSAAAEQREVLEGRSMVIEPYRLTVTSVKPEPLSTQKIAPGDYRITLIVVKI